MIDGVLLPPAASNETSEPLPDNPNTYIESALASRLIGERTKAIADLIAFITLQPDRLHGYPANSIVHLLMEKHQKALMNRAAPIEGQVPDPYLECGAALLLVGKYPEAINDLSSSIALDSDNPNAYLARGDAHYAAGSYGRAIEDYTTVIAYQRENTMAYIGRSAAHIKSKNYPRAIADLTASIELQPHNPNAYLLRAKAHELSGQNIFALADFEMAKRQGMPGLDERINSLTLLSQSPRLKITLARVSTDEGKVQFSSSLSSNSPVAAERSPRVSNAKEIAGCSSGKPRFLKAFWPKTSNQYNTL